MKWKTNEELMADEQVVKAAKDWLCDCEWADVDEEYIREVSPRIALRAVQKFYCGGVKQFLKDDCLT